MTRYLDRIAAVAAVAAIRVYQLVGSRLHGRTCLFAPTCSHRAVKFFKEMGFRDGMAATRRQLAECRGTYSLRLDAKGDVEMITGLGTLVPPTEVSPVIKAKLLSFNPMAMAAQMTTEFNTDAVLNAGTDAASLA
jgi:putative component of membrane protein insertase Oxa1/YidC/SpoIIIJ protein YidD